MVRLSRAQRSKRIRDKYTETIRNRPVVNALAIIAAVTGAVVMIVGAIQQNENSLKVGAGTMASALAVAAGGGILGRIRFMGADQNDSLILETPSGRSTHRHQRNQHCN